MHIFDTTKIKLGNPVQIGFMNEARAITGNVTNVRGNTMAVMYRQAGRRNTAIIQAEDIAEGIVDMGWTDSDGARRHYPEDALLAPMPGVTQVVYSNDQIVIDKEADVFPLIDTGIELKDGAIYEYIISAMDGNLGTVDAIGNVLVPTFFVDGEPTAAIGAELLSTPTFGFLKHYYCFRAQFKRNYHADDGSLLLAITPTSGAVGHAYCVDSAGATGQHIDAVPGEETRFIELLPDPQLVNMTLEKGRVTFGVINLGILTADVVSDGLKMRLLVKITERTSGDPIL